MKTHQKCVIINSLIQKEVQMKLFTASSAKLDKSQTEQWLNAVLYLEPSVDYKSICQASSAGCRASCLTNSGMMRMPAQTNARVQRTKMYLTERDNFMVQLEKEITAYLLKATKAGKKLALRLNGTSDLDWFEVYAKFPQVQFYEYTKRPDIVLRAKKTSNLHVTFSRNEKTKDSTMQRIIESGANVAVVFDDKKQMPLTYMGMNVINGDAHDRRFEDGTTQIVGLKLKGTNATKALARQVGFAI